jgi:hypothetical protein
VKLGDQPFRGDARVPIDEVADTAGVHARTVATCSIDFLPERLPKDSNQ